MSLPNLFFRPHLGLGDHIVCNGMVRELHKKYDKFVMPVKCHNVKSVSRMFEDLDNVRLLSVINDFEADSHALNYTRIGFEVLNLGHYGSSFMQNVKTFDESFYVQAKVEYEKRWDTFFYPINKEKEREVYMTFCDEVGEEYIFVHDDPSRSLSIDKSHLPDLPIVSPGHKFGTSGEINFFDYGLLIRNSHEIHCMDSSFAIFIDHLNTDKVKRKMIHRYLRNQNMNPYYRNNWEII